ncbi:UNVERIFIED_CONTAM: hypothetical protein GTU68_044108 [Idotea baltica]|nr:hypothetical protein [Idotea baltica]
MRMSLRES